MAETYASFTTFGKRKNYKDKSSTFCYNKGVTIPIYEEKGFKFYCKSTFFKWEIHGNFMMAGRLMCVSTTWTFLGGPFKACFHWTLQELTLWLDPLDGCVSATETDPSAMLWICLLCNCCVTLPPLQAKSLLQGRYLDQKNSLVVAQCSLVTNRLNL